MDQGVPGALKRRHSHHHGWEWHISTKVRPWLHCWQNYGMKLKQLRLESHGEGPFP